MMVNIPKIRGCLLSISTNFNRLSTDQSEKQEADLALPNLTGRKMDLSICRGLLLRMLSTSVIGGIGTCTGY